MIHDLKKVFESQGSGCFDVGLGDRAAVVKNNPDQKAEDVDFLLYESSGRK